MIQQTLEWHRFGDERPEDNSQCLLMRSYLFEPGYCVPESARYDARDNRSWCWESKTTSYKERDTDLWAYWSEPKEEK